MSCAHPSTTDRIERLGLMDRDPRCPDIRRVHAHTVETSTVCDECGDVLATHLYRDPHEEGVTP